MTPSQFAAKWRKVNLSERSACQQHFLDLCELIDCPKPAAADPTGDWYTFEKRVTTTDGSPGFADVWMRGHFAWEYKRKQKNLAAAYEQLLRYREALGNPPLLVVSDIDRIVIHTNFTNFAKKEYEVRLADLPDPVKLGWLRSAFTAPLRLRPDKTQEQITREVAGRFAELAEGMRGRGVEPHRAAHFLMKLMFCMFAEDIGLLDENLFTDTVGSAQADPDALGAMLADLFAKMAKGGYFGKVKIDYFNGGLFADANAVPLLPGEIDQLHRAALYDWGSVEPTIFGTLFERTLDPDKRSQIGAHYTGRDDVEAVLRPVFLDPLRREWDEARAEADRLWARVEAARVKSKPRRAFEAHVDRFLVRLSKVTVLDPACGSGNFLYVALSMLLDLEKEVLTYRAARTGQTVFPGVRPTQLRGLEVNPYARNLAAVAVWIGYLQWRMRNGYHLEWRPILDPMDRVREEDAILDLSDPDDPREPNWPDAEFIVGNPPFLGGKMLRSHLGDQYVNALFKLWGDRVRPEADLCCYWFEKARAAIEAGRAKRAGLLATQGIRGGANRDTLARIKRAGDIFFAVSDRDWVLDGANVHISMVGFDGGTEQRRELDGRQVAAIHANLSAGADTTQARPLAANLNVGFMGDTKGGPFDMPPDVAHKLLTTPNVNGRPSSDVVTPWCNGLDVTRRSRNYWVIDFGIGMSEKEASHYDDAFNYLKQHAEAARGASRSRVKAWWLHERPRVDMREALASLPRFVSVARVAKHLMFVWMESPVLPDCQLITFARSDDYFFGVLHSRVHEVWARSQGTQVRERESGFRYTPTTCFETFPFPEPFAALRREIGEAAKELDRLRSNWLNPPEWTREDILTFPGSADGPWKRYVHDPDERGVGTVRYPRRAPKDAECAAKLKARTLTNLYNERPGWLAAAHRRLDGAVAAAYGWPADLPDDELLRRLLALNLERAGATDPQQVAAEKDLRVGV